MRAGDKGIDAFEAVDHAVVEQLFQGAVNLQRRTETVTAQLVEDGVGAQGPFGARQRIEHQGLVLCQLMGGCSGVIGCQRQEDAGWT
eukprot:gene9540-11695_t